MYEKNVSDATMNLSETLSIEAVDVCTTELVEKLWLDQATLELEGKKQRQRELTRTGIRWIVLLHNGFWRGVSSSKEDEYLH
jgi:hypothetical protein